MIVVGIFRIIITESSENPQAGADGTQEAAQSPIRQEALFGPLFGVASYKSICKINFKRNSGTGFLCKIPQGRGQRDICVLLASYHVLKHFKPSENRSISFHFEDLNLDTNEQEICGGHNEKILILGQWGIDAVSFELCEQFINDVRGKLKFFQATQGESLRGPRHCYLPSSRE